MPEFRWTDEDAQLAKRVESLKKVGETDNAFAKRCGLDAGNLNKFKKQQVRLGTNYLRRIAYACKVSLEWLQTGTGNKNADTTDKVKIAEVLSNAQVFKPRLNEQSTMVKINENELLESLKAENEAMRSVLDTVKEIMPVLQQALKQNADILAQNKELISMFGTLFPNKLR